MYSHRIYKRQAKALISLRVCAGWSEPLLVVHTSLLEISCRGSNFMKALCGSVSQFPLSTFINVSIRIIALYVTHELLKGGHFLRFGFCNFLFLINGDRQFLMSSIPKRTSKWPLFNLALTILKYFLHKYVHCNGLKLSGALEEFSITSQFLGSKMQKLIF